MGGHCGHVCPMCMDRVMRQVMGHALQGVIGMCKSTNCPVMKKICDWSRNHKEMAFGMLLGKVEPWKFAMGRCWRRGDGGNHGDHPHRQYRKDQLKQIEVQLDDPTPEPYENDIMI